MTPTSVVDKDQVSLPVKTAVATVGHALLGASTGVLYKTIAKKFVYLQVITAVFGGIDGGIICAMKGIRGKDDTKARAVAGFTSGFMLYLVGNMPSPPIVPFAIGTGLILALYNGLVHEVAFVVHFLNYHIVIVSPPRTNKCDMNLVTYFCLLQTFIVKSRSEPPAVEDTRYTRTRCMLSELGLEGYEKQFKKHFDLEKAGIHLGARKLILNHIERCRL
ncbi:hypothetical protein MKX03_036651 [Papaver bracteatum]|nr:hypothetical protein MKX03_036651 [Papaver bracteatum]